MRKNNFCVMAERLRVYAMWERELYEAGIDLMGTPASELAESVWSNMVGYDPSFSYDEKLGLDWIWEWCYTPDSPNFTQTRHGRTWDLTEAGVLYDFLVFMNEHGWED